MTEDAAAGDTHWAEEDAPTEAEDDSEPVDLGGDDDYGSARVHGPEPRAGRDRHERRDQRTASRSKIDVKS